MTKPRTASEIYCERRKAEMTASLKLFVSAGTLTKPATAAPAHAQSPLPSAGAAHNSGFLLDLGLTDEEARRIEESF